MNARVAGRKSAINANQKGFTVQGSDQARFHPARHADYAEHGATCLSVLTDEKYQGANVFRSKRLLPVSCRSFARIL